MAQWEPARYLKPEEHDMEAKLVASRFFKLGLVALLAIALACATLIRPAFADESDSSASASDSSASASDSSAAASSDSSSASSASIGKPDGVEGVAASFGDKLPLMGNDYVWFGRELALSKQDIDNDLIAAGQVVRLSDITAKGSIRAAAQDIVLDNAVATENITVAGQDVVIRNSSGNAIAAAGNTVAFTGTCNELTAYAETVFIDGTVEGDVIVGANSVEIGKDARIKGTLYVSAPSDPVMQRGAKVGDVQFTQTEGSASSAQIEGALASFSSMFLVLMAVLSIVGTIVVAVLAEWLFRRHTVAAAEMIRNRTGATIGTGVVAAIVAPIVIVILIGLGITLPVAAALTFALLAMTSVAGGFAGASLFKLAFPKLGRFACALAGGAIIGVVGAIPILGSIVHALAFMYLLGYALQSIYLGMRDPATAA